MIIVIRNRQMTLEALVDKTSIFTIGLELIFKSFHVVLLLN